jgi:hypothetical protein
MNEKENASINKEETKSQKNKAHDTRVRTKK